MSKFLLVFFILFSTYLHSKNIDDAIEINCKITSLYYDNLLLDPAIKINVTLNHRNYVKKILNKISFNNNYTNNWSKAEVTVENGRDTCKYPAKYRLTGDSYWHYQYETNFENLNNVNIQHSLLIKLTHDNINGITKFKLILPKARENAKNFHLAKKFYGDSEIISAELFRLLGFISPRTHKLGVKINDQYYTYLFQEHISKELLEFHGRQEGFIFEGDESIGLSQKFGFPRIVNSNYLSKGYEAKKMAISSKKLIEKAYLKTSFSNYFNYENSELLLLTNDILHHNKDDKSKHNLIKFETLSYAINAIHGLSMDDSRFYFNKIYGRFENIYYDGKPSFLKLDIKNIPFEIKQNAINLKNELNQIEILDFYNIIKKRGYNGNLQDLNKKFEIINNNLDYMSKLPIREIITKKYNINLLSDFFAEKQIAFLIDILDIKNNKVSICDNKFENCLVKILDNEDFKKLFEHRFTFKNQKTLNFSKKNFEDDVLDYSHSIFEWKDIKIGNTTMRIQNNVSVDINFNLKKILIEINQPNNNQVLFHNGSLEGWTIKYKNPFKTNFLQSRFSEYGLEGCLSFHDMNTKKINIFADGSNCEDTLHFMRVNGSIDTINVFNAYADGIDIDYSDLSINKINVKNANNDCVDFSSGNYRINLILSANCNDKSISAGEKSILLINNIESKNSEIGVAAKDSSIVKIINGNFKSNNICVAVYRKKREFDLATVNLLNVNCKEEIINNN